MNLKSFPSLDRGASSTRAHPHSMGQNKFNRSIVASVLSLAAVATVCQPEKAAAINLKFANPVQATDIANLQGVYGAAYSGTVMQFTNVAGAGVNATVTAAVYGTGYNWQAQVPNYSTAANEPAGDLGYRYTKAANTTGLGGLNYTIQLWDSTIGSGFTSAYTANTLNFLVYDVDGELEQGEYLRIGKNSGLVGYQLGADTATSMTFTDTPTGYLFSGRDINRNEDSAQGGSILYFENVSSVTFGFEANTRTAINAVNGVFGAIDADLSYVASYRTVDNGPVTGASSFGAYQSTKIPEPFTIVGSLVGGGVALRMRKKLKATSKA
jgi:hypothetical protein